MESICATASRGQKCCSIILQCTRLSLQQTVQSKMSVALRVKNPVLDISYLLKGKNKKKAGKNKLSE